LDENNERIISHCEQGGWAAIIEKGYFTICKGEWQIRIAKVKDVPLTMDGRAVCMIKNVLPSILAAAISGVDSKNIRKALYEFIPGPELTPGRMNIFKFRNCEVMLDYAHNPDGFHQLKLFMNEIKATTKVGIIGCAGDRRDEDIRKMGMYAAQMFDQIIIRHDEDSRGRTNEEITRLLTEGIESVKTLPVQIISDEIKAIQYAIENAERGTFITVTSDDTKSSIGFLKQLQEDTMPLTV